MHHNQYEESTISINDNQICYRDWGGQGKSLLLLHGLASHKGIWDLVAPLLALYTNVHSLDLRGHGRSSKPSCGYDFDTIGNDVRQFWEKRNLRNPILIGHSWGGNVALQCAVNFSGQVQGLIMVDGGFIEPSARQDWTWERAREELAPPNFDSITLDELKVRIKQGDLASYWNPNIEQIILSNFYTTSDGYAKPHLDRENHIKIIRALWEHKPSTLYAKVQCPALVLAASGSRRGNYMDQTRTNLVHQAGALLSKGQVIWMKDTIHDVPLQRPQELTDLIINFLNNLP